MFNLKRVLFAMGIAASPIVFTGCSVGTSSLFVHPSEQGYDYEVTYDTLGGQINQEEKRVVYYANDSLLYEPSGTSGMLVAPKNGDKTLQGWYTSCTAKETDNGTVYEFNEDDLWDYENEHITEENAPEHKLTLYAKWAKNPSINFVDAQDPQKCLLTWSISVGKTLQRPTSTEPTKDGNVLLDYYADEDCTKKFEFNQVIDETKVSFNESGEASLNIYCKFKEGQATRIRTADQLKAIESAPDADYILAADIDLTGADWVPIDNFTGSFDGNGYAIKNMKMTVKNRVTGIAAKKATEKSYGLFSTLDGAKILNLTIQNAEITLDTASNVGVCVGSLAGRSTKTTIENCKLSDITFTSTGSINADVVIAAITAGDSSVRINQCQMDNINADAVSSQKSLQKMMEY